MYFKSKKYLKNRLNEFVSVSDLDISDLKDNLLPIIKGVDTYCWSYIKKRERNSSRVVSISLNTDSEFQRLFDAVKQTNSVWKFYKYVPSTDLEVCFAYFDIQNFTDFKQLLEDPECRDIIEKEANVKFIFNSDRKNDLLLLAKERRRFRREQEKVNDIYSYFNYTWDENEALAAVTNKRHVWVVRTNEYPNLPALFFYPKTPINSKDEEELISKYSHKLATAYKYELRDPSVNAYWLARPCRYPWFKEHPMPDGSELIIKINESKNKLTNMNTLNRDRNTLKRLVESYGKKDVVNFIQHINERYQGTSNTLLIVDISGSFEDNVAIYPKLTDIFKKLNEDKCLVAGIGSNLENLGYAENLGNGFDISLEDIRNSYSGPGFGSNFSALKSIQDKFKNVILVTDTDVYPQFDNVVNLGRDNTVVLISEDNKRVSVYSTLN